MSLYCIGDLHLSIGEDKPMDIFHGWENYTELLEKGWKNTVSHDDTVVVPGDISWAMKLSESYEDFKFLDSLPGRKIISKGNHDYWWTTYKKMNDFLADNNFSTISILHNNHYKYGDFGICGTRGWVKENGEEADAKILAREASRLEASIISAEKEGLFPLVFLHYPPVYAGNVNFGIMEILKKHGIRSCRYGHIHGRACEYAVNGLYDGIEMSLVSSDYIHFTPVKIL